MSIYIASKTAYADQWRFLRSVGWPIISTWIDEAEQGQTSNFDDLWNRCIHEAATCEFFLIYKMPQDTLKGAWIELGAALASGRPRILAVGIGEFSIAKLSKIEHFPTVMDALFTTGYK